MKKPNEFMIGFLCGLIPLFAVVIIMAADAPSQQVKQEKEEYIYACKGGGCSGDNVFYVCAFRDSEYRCRQATVENDNEPD